MTDFDDSDDTPNADEIIETLFSTPERIPPRPGPPPAAPSGVARISSAIGSAFFVVLSLTALAAFAIGAVKLLALLWSVP